MYACSPKWNADWLPTGIAEKILSQLAYSIQTYTPAPFINRMKISVNHGIHFTGGEPFINFKLLQRLVEIAHKLELPSTFVETNCYWCVDEHTTEEKLAQLQSAGLTGILISANPFVVEHVPFERIVRAVKISRKLFGNNVIIYQELFYSQLQRLRITGTLPIDTYISRMRKIDKYSLEAGLSYPSLLLMGRAPYKLGYLYRKCAANKLLNTSCRDELTRGWHIHIDNYLNYMTGYCAGISIGDARNITALTNGIELEDRPILKALTNSLRELYEFAVKNYGYRELPQGYISKCHLCVDIRRHIVANTTEFKELKPLEFYSYLKT
jgi:hypothetical protein